MQKYFKLSTVAILCSLMIGCATTNDINLSQQFWSNKKQTVALATDNFPTGNLYQVGQEGFLDVLINKSITHKFQRHLEVVSLQDVTSLPNKYKQALNERSVEAFVVSYPIDTKHLKNSHMNKNTYAAKNFIPLAGQINANKLLIISASHVGAERHYYNFIPTSAPVATITLEGQLVDLSDNSILWRHRAEALVNVEGNWDQPPHYPNFDKAFKLAVNSVTDELYDSFMSGAS